MAPVISNILSKLLLALWIPDCAVLSAGSHDEHIGLSMRIGTEPRSPTTCAGLSSTCLWFKTAAGNPSWQWRRFRHAQSTTFLTTGVRMGESGDRATRRDGGVRTHSLSSYNLTKYNSLRIFWWKKPVLSEEFYLKTRVIVSIATLVSTLIENGFTASISPLPGSQTAGSRSVLGCCLYVGGHRGLFEKRIAIGSSQFFRVL